MRARDSQSKIRPLPVDDIDSGVSHGPSVEPPRRWLPLVVIALGALAFAIITLGLSPDGSSEVASVTTIAPVAEPEPTTTTDPPPSPLELLLPPATDGLKLVIREDLSTRVGWWDLGAAAPSLSAPNVRADAASYNADGSYVAIHSYANGGSLVIEAVTTEHVRAFAATTEGEPVDGSVPLRNGPRVYVDQSVTSGLWHPTAPHLLAWASPRVEATGETVTTIRVADVSGYARQILEPMSEVIVPAPGLELVAWGDWGFAVVEPWAVEEPLITLFDPDGMNPLTVEGTFFDSTADGTLLLARSEGETLVPYVLTADRTEMSLPGLDIGATDLRLTSDGGWVLATTRQPDGHMSVFARTVVPRSTRITSIEEPADIVDVTADDHFLVLQERESGDLVFKDWSAGTEYRLPIDGRVLAVSL